MADCFIMRHNSNQKRTPISYVTDGLINLWEWNGNMYNSVTGEDYVNKGDTPQYVYDDMLGRNVGLFNSTAIYGSNGTKVADENMTLQCLFRFPNNDYRDGVFMCLGRDNTTELASLAIGNISFNNNYLSAIYSKTSNSQNFVASTKSPFFKNEWHMMTVTIDSNAEIVEGTDNQLITLYIDGIANGVGIFTRHIIPITDKFIAFGVFAGGSLALSNTYLCNFATWEKALTADEVKQNWLYDKKRYNL